MKLKQFARFLFYSAIVFLTPFHTFNIKFYAFLVCLQIQLPPPLLGGAISKALTLPRAKFPLAFQTINIETVIQLCVFQVLFIKEIHKSLKFRLRCVNNDYTFGLIAIFVQQSFEKTNNL